MMNRRGLITGLISFVAAPAIVRAASLMPVKAMIDELPVMSFTSTGELPRGTWRIVSYGDLTYRFNVRINGVSLSPAA